MLVRFNIRLKQMQYECIIFLVEPASTHALKNVCTTQPKERLLDVVLSNVHFPELEKSIMRFLFGINTF